MKERPILFSTEMVQAILERRKTMTRRVIKTKAFDVQSYEHSSYEMYSDPRLDTQYYFKNEGERGEIGLKCQYGELGDILWVRETWSKINGHYEYKAKYNTAVSFNWKPSIHMPRSAARILLQITNVRVERLKSIPDTDIKHEGVEIHIPVPGDGEPNPRLQFKRLWESINSLGSWDANPWVWVIEFERINII